MEEWDYAFDPKKNAWLIKERGVSFEQIIALIEDGKLIQVLEHPDTERYPHQLLYEVEVDGYVHVVPVVREGRTLFLKTIYSSGLSQSEGDPETHERRARMKKLGFHDDDEKDLITAYESGEFKPVKDQKAAKRTAVATARRYLRKDARVNIRLSTADLQMLKLRGVEEGLPYQSLIASVLHKYVSGRAPSGKKT